MTDLGAFQLIPQRAAADILLVLAVWAVAFADYL